MLHFIPHEHVRRGETIKTALYRADRSDMHGVMRIKLTTGGNEAIRKANRIERERGLVQQKISMSLEPSALAARS